MPEKAKKNMPPIKNDNVLPADFDGVFRFTNWTDKEFKAKWNKIEYTFPPLSMVPLIISNASPEDVQHIRKKFARELAEQEFYRSDRFKALDDQAKPGSGVVPGIYSESELAPFVQKCLEPLPESRASATRLANDKTENYHTEHTQVIDQAALDAKKPLVEGSAVVTA
jgi:hypothetical protein